MTIEEFRAMGTSWWVQTDAEAVAVRPADIVERLEAQLSRFRPDSAVSRLNRCRAARDPLLAQVLGMALRMRDATAGAFDPTMGAELAALGYNRTFSTITVPSIEQHVVGRTWVRAEIDGTLVRLAGPGAIDLGGIGKGFAVDVVICELIAQGARSVIVDGGGDIGVAGGPWRIGVGGGLDIELHDGAVATSSKRVRRWTTACGQDVHHIIDPRTGLPSASCLDEAVVVAPDAATADALATAVLADPARVVPLLEPLGAHALVHETNGAWWTTPAFPFGYEPRQGASLPWVSP